MRTYKIAPGTLMNLAQLQQKVTAGYEQAANNVLTLIKQVGRNSPMGDELVNLHRHLEFERGQSDRFIGMLREGIVPKGFMIGHPKGDDLVRALIRPAHDNPNRWSENAKYDQALANQTVAILNSLSERRNRLDQLYDRLLSFQPPVYRRYATMQTRKAVANKTVSGDLSGLMQTLLPQIGIFTSMYESLANNDTPSAQYLAKGMPGVQQYPSRARLISQRIQTSDWRGTTVGYAKDLANDILGKTRMLSIAWHQPGAAKGNIENASHLAFSLYNRLFKMADMLHVQREKEHTADMGKLEAARHRP